MMVGRELKKIQEEDSDLEVKEIDVVANPRKSWQEGIRMIPTLIKGKKKLSGIFLSSKQIRDFLITNRKMEPPELS
jgi:hypothetical protein